MLNIYTVVDISRSRLEINIQAIQMQNLAGEVNSAPGGIS